MTSEPVRVLYIDDDDALVRLVQRALGRRGFVVEHATSGDAALKRIREGGIDVIALDHYLAEGTGIDFLGRLRSEAVAPAVVYVTGSAETSVAVAALKEGASDFVAKTVGDDFMVLLHSSLEQAVEKSRLETARAEAEQEVRAARDRAELLLREVNHRVANSLAMVSSLVGLQANLLQDQAAKDALAETQGRIYAISLVHKSLYSSDDVRFVEIREYLDGVLSHLSLAMRSEGHTARLHTNIATMPVPTDTAINVGVAVTELVTNAYKYAYPNNAGDCEIRVDLSGGNDGQPVVVAVSDDGVGWDGTGQIKGTGLGSRIVKAMATSLNAEVEYVDRAPGTTARLSFQLPEG
jgi:two-component sensor histidine kinase/CheY-like chemotaxis protein